MQSAGVEQQPLFPSLSLSHSLSLALFPLISTLSPPLSATALRRQRCSATPPSPLSGSPDTAPHPNSMLEWGGWKEGEGGRVLFVFAAFSATTTWTFAYLNDASEWMSLNELTMTKYNSCPSRPSPPSPPPFVSSLPLSLSIPAGDKRMHFNATVKERATEMRNKWKIRIHLNVLVCDYLHSLPHKQWCKSN